MDPFGANYVRGLGTHTDLGIFGGEHSPTIAKKEHIFVILKMANLQGGGGGGRNRHFRSIKFFTAFSIVEIRLHYKHFGNHTNPFNKRYSPFQSRAIPGKLKVDVHRVWSEQGASYQKPE